MEEFHLFFLAFFTGVSAAKIDILKLYDNSNPVIVQTVDSC